MIRSTIQFNFKTISRPQVLARRRGGFSLIEVAIAMAIFVFGALAIVRIFPGALGVVQNSEQRAIGQRMAQSTQARLLAQPRSIPYSLFDTNSNFMTTSPSAWSDFPGAVFGTNTDDNLSLAQAAPETGDITSPNSSLNQSAMGHFRRISSETQRVSGTGEVVLNFPYEFADAGTFNPALNPVIKIRRNVEGVTIDANGVLDFTNARLNGAPFNDTTLPVTNINRPPNTDTTNYQTAGKTTNNREDVTFYVSYNWTNGGYTNGVQDEPKQFHGNASWNPVTSPRVAQAAAGFNVVPGPVKIWFYISAAATNAQQGNAAYDPNVGRMLLTTYAGQLVDIDYTVPDWRFIVTDNNLTTRISDADTIYLQDQGLTPTTANTITQLVLPTRYVADVPIGDSRAQLYALLRGTTATSAPVVSRAAWSPDYTATTEPANVRQADAAVTYKPLAVRPKTGQVFFDVTSLVSPSARVVYRNVEGWVQQPAIAARFYLPYTDGADPTLFPREPWREYFYNRAATTAEPIYFHASEAGKSITASYVYLDNGNYITMNDVPIPIEGDVQDRPAVVPAAFNGQYLLNGTAAPCTKVALAYLRDNQGRSIGASVANGGNATARIIGITEIRGASIRVRSGWFDGSRYTQTSVVGYRPLDVDSYNRS